MSARWLVLVVLSLPGLAIAAACPPPLPHAQLRSYANDDAVSGYVTVRWLKCGWPAAVPVLKPVARLTLENARAAADRDDPNDLLESDELFETLSMIVISNPGAVAGMLTEHDEEPAENDPPGLAELLRLRVTPAQIAKNFEQGVEPAIAWLREQYVLPRHIDGRFELALIAIDVRRGDIDGARARVAAAAPRYAESDVIDAESDSDEDWKAMRAALAEPVAQSSAASGPGIRIDRSTVKDEPRLLKCGTGALMEHLYGVGYLREHVLRAAPIDTAIGELLGQWREPVGAGGGAHFDLLVELLKKRYGGGELEQGLGDAIATLRNDEHVAGMNLFGQFVALPSHVLEDDATTPGGVRERRLEQHELAELVRDTRLYRLLQTQSR